MLRILPPRRFFVVLFGLLAASLVIFISLWRLNLSLLGDTTDGVQASAGERIRQLVTLPILPDHPLYIIGMISDRVDLWLATPEERFALKLEYADTRLTTSQHLLQRKRRGMALTTLTKAEKYIISAAEEIPILPKELQESARASLLSTIQIHDSMIRAIKPAFSDPQQATIDRLLEQILILQENR